MAGAAIGEPVETVPDPPAGHGLRVEFMGYHGITWASMGTARNTLENLGFLAISARFSKS
jgi:hypothetical protein